MGKGRVSVREGKSLLCPLQCLNDGTFGSREKQTFFFALHGLFIGFKIGFTTVHVPCLSVENPASSLRYDLSLFDRVGGGILCIYLKNKISCMYDPFVLV